MECYRPAQQQLAPLHRQAAAAHHGTQCIAQLYEDANHQVVKACSPMAATSPPWIPCWPMYVRPAHFNLLCADWWTQSAASQAVKCLARGMIAQLSDIHIVLHEAHGTHVHFLFNRGSKNFSKPIVQEITRETQDAVTHRSSQFAQTHEEHCA